MNAMVFRGRRSDNGTWVMSKCVLTLDDGYYMPQQITDCRVFKDEHGNIRAINDTVIYKIDKDTIGQHVGLRDIKGRAIFEGDIVRISETEFIVGFKTGRFLLQAPFLEVPLEYGAVCEIVGNVHARKWIKA